MPAQTSIESSAHLKKATDVKNCTTAGHAFVVVKEVFRHRNCNIWHRKNDKMTKHYINEHLYFERNLIT